MGVRLAMVRELLNRQKLGTSEAVTLMRDDGTVLMRLPFDLKDIGHPIEPFAPFLVFSRTGQPTVSTRATTEIAQTLFVSLKTVEAHLSKAYSKLGLSGQGARSRLAEAVGEVDSD